MAVVEFKNGKAMFPPRLWPECSIEDEVADYGKGTRWPGAFAGISVGEPKPYDGPTHPDVSADEEVNAYLRHVYGSHPVTPQLIAEMEAAATAYVRDRGLGESVVLRMDEAPGRWPWCGC